MHRRYSTVKVMSGNIEPATLRRKTFSGKDLELVVSVEKKGVEMLPIPFIICPFCYNGIPL